MKNNDVSKAAVAGLFAVAAVLGALPGCSSGSSGSSSEKGVSGTFRGSAVGMGGSSNPVTVSLTLENGVITAVTAEGPGETEGIGSKAIDTLPGEMVASNSVTVDSVSGATITSKAIMEAAAAALAEAGLDPSDLQVKETAAVQAEDFTEDTDIVIIGAGGAGMTAAITAADAGKSVIILESQPLAGGNTVRATGGLNAAGTPEQKKMEFKESSGVEKTLATAKEDWADNEAITSLAETVQKQWDEWQKSDQSEYFDTPELMALDTMIGGHGINNPDLVKTLTENSAGAIEWLHEHDADLTLVGAAGGASVKRIHSPEDENGKKLAVGAYIVPILEKNVEDRGIEILYNTTAKKILTDDTGAAVGVEAEGSDGNTVTIHAEAVIDTAGGFGANMDMVTQYRPELAGFCTTNAAGSQGQGIILAQEIGADTVDMDQIQIHPTVHLDDDGNAHLITEGLRGDGAILVNQEGKRFYDEVSTRDKVSAAEIEQTDSSAWLIIDQKMVDASAVIQGYIDAGYTYTGNTPEELAEQIGIDPSVLAETVSTWNGYVAAGEDPDFGRTSFADPLDTAPYYAIKVTPGIHHTMGGLRINTSSEVLNTEGNAIPGLFAAGEVTGGVHGGNRLGGTAVTDIIVFGQIAGNSAVSYIGSKTE